MPPCIAGIDVLLDANVGRGLPLRQLAATGNGVEVIETVTQQLKSEDRQVHHTWVTACFLTNQNHTNQTAFPS
jgi:hypothetical protein